MQYSLAKSLGGGFAMSLLFAAVWVIICKAIPPLRNKLSLCFGVAIALAFVPSLVTIGGPNILSIIASLICAGLLFWQFKRAQKKQSFTSAP